MDSLLHILSALVGFSTVMLAASLIVMTIVRLIQYLANRRGKTLTEMLGSLNLGYRQAHGDDARPGDAAQAAFVLDILNFPMLDPTAELRPAPQGPGSIVTIERQRRLAAERVEYIAQADLIRVVRRLAYLEKLGTLPAAGAAEAKLVDGLDIPARWHAALPQDSRRVSTLISHIKSWFKTAEGVSSETFKLESRHLTTVVSSILVVLINLDGITLATSFVKNPELSAAISARAPDVLTMAERSLERTDEAPVEREALLEELGSDLRAHNAILNEPGLAIGWQHSPIVKSWCLDCRDPGRAEARSTAGKLLDILRVLIGLSISTVLLSLGAPFWTDQLRTLLNLQNSVKQLKDPSAATRAKKNPPR